MFKLIIVLWGFIGLGVLIGKLINSNEWDNPYNLSTKFSLVAFIFFIIGHSVIILLLCLKSTPLGIREYICG